MSPPAPLLRLEHFNESCGAVQALTDISVDFPAGQVTALAGDNGDGKSVLTKCNAGIHAPDSGQMLWNGQPVRMRKPA